MIRPWVNVSLRQYERLKRLTEKIDRSLSETIREAVCEFVKKKDFPVSTTTSHLPRGTRDRYKSVSAYLARSDWHLLAEISKKTGRCKTELVREAVDRYFRECK